MSDLPSVGTWTSGTDSAAFSSQSLIAALPHFRQPVHVVREPEAGRVGIAYGGQVQPVNGHTNADQMPWLATLPALYPEWLGDRSFNEVHGVRFPYVTGAMANGIATTDIVIAMCRAGMLGFFGAAGLRIERVSAALDEIIGAVGDGDHATWGSNLIHSPNEPALEEAVVDLYLQRKVRRVSAAAYMSLTPAVVRYAASGLYLDADGRVQRRNHLFAKISRPEVARRFMAPAPAEMLDALVAEGKLSAEEAQLARRVAVAEDYTVEADSGGHTDNQSLTALFPTLCRLRDEMMAEHGFDRPIRLGAAGGLGTPAAVAAAFGLGAAYVVTGSVNQASVESGLSVEGKKLLAQAQLADVVMAPAADMFELGVEVQVLKRGTMFGVRASRLYELYNKYDGLDSIPADTMAQLEKSYFHGPAAEVWNQTQAFFAKVDPAEIERAERDPKHKMALVFRWYLGKSSGWAIQGAADRKLDYQIWCGPAMGAFNAWVEGTFLADLDNRTVVQIALNLLEGAAVITRCQQLRSYGVPVPASAFQFTPRPLA